MDFVRLFKETRSELKLSREKLAFAMGVSQSKIIAIELGKNVPTGKDLVNLAKVANMSLSNLIARFEDNNPYECDNDTVGQPNHG